MLEKEQEKEKRHFDKGYTSHTIQWRAKVGGVRRGGAPGDSRWMGGPIR